jgi:hypothetical protein
MTAPKIPYYITKGGSKPNTRCMGYWSPCLARPHKATGIFEPTLMAKLGFAMVACGEDGPAAWATARAMNERWKLARAAHLAGAPVGECIKMHNPMGAEVTYPANSLGACFAQYRATNVWAGKKPRTQEDWWRGWALIEPVFGRRDPRGVALEDVDRWYAGDVAATGAGGLLARVGVREAHRAMKIFRALWKVGKSLKRPDGKRYCVGDDPSLSIRRKTPVARALFYREGEAVRLVKRAWRMGFKGLACIYAIAWDTQFSPVDARGVTPAQWKSDLAGPLVKLERTKTGKDAIGTLSRRTVALVEAYLAEFRRGADMVALRDSAPMFRTPGGRRWRPVPYSRNLLARHHRIVREVEFPGDNRTIMDFRRSGAIEAVAGGASLEELAVGMGNTIDRSRELLGTYVPRQASVVRLADEARVRGRGRIRDG